MADDFEEIAKAFEEMAEALEQGLENTGLPEDEIVEEGPDVPDLNMDVPGEPEYHFASLKQLARDLNTSVGTLQQTVPDDVLDDPGFWKFISAQAGTETVLRPLQQPLDGADSDGPSPEDIIRNTVVASVADVSPNEGQVDLPTSADEVNVATEQKLIEALTGVREQDQKLDNLHEARERLSQAVGVAGNQLQKMTEDREKLQAALERGEGDTDLMRDLLNEVDTRIDEAEELIQIAREKIERIESRGEDIVADRNEYRAYVKALMRKARADEDSPIHGRVDQIYRGYRIRSGDDVKFRADPVKHVLVMIQVRNNRGDKWVTQDYLVQRGQEVYGYSREQIAQAVNLLRLTGEIIKQGNEYRINPIIES